MLKMLIADDERVIRETIRQIIDWEALGIRIVGLCKNGLEAYDMTLDESPDIVLTDINMPGLSGLELIRRIMNTDHNTQFIILSGYGDYSYTKQAMKLGIQHYLLKPCNEHEIVDVIKAVKKQCAQKHLQQLQWEEHYMMLRRLHESVVHNLLVECLAAHPDFAAVARQYEPFLNFTNVEYELCELSCSPQGRQDAALAAFQKYHNSYAPQIPYYCVWVDDLCLITFESYDYDYLGLDRKLCDSYEGKGKYRRISLKSIHALLPVLHRYIRPHANIEIGPSRQKLIGKSEPTKGIQAFQEDPVEKIKTYVYDHLSDEKLTLKKICANVLFMNADYVSRRFKEKTGGKFSAFLADTRVEYAKKLFEEGMTSINGVAACVGCRNNPQYFSQLFKKITGMTPTDYIRAWEDGHRIQGNAQRKMH